VNPKLLCLAFVLSGVVTGRVTIELQLPAPDQIPGLIRLSYAINPSGPRVLR
jgi:hypothetical protein